MVPTLLEEVVAGRAPAVVPFTVEQYHRMLEAGILPEDAAAELVDGVLVHKDRSDAGGDPMSHGQRHALVLRRLVQLDRRLQALPCHLQVQLPLTLTPTCEPEPDLAVVRGSPDDFRDRHPGPGDVLVIMEVSDSSLVYDRTTKLRLYAAAGIPQYWILNSREDVLEIHSKPAPAERSYARVREVRPGDRAPLEIGAGQGIDVDLSELLRR